MNTWFRFYNQAMRDPKVMRLCDADFRLWISLLAVASENDGSIPPVSDLKLLLNRRLDYLLSGLTRLVKAELIDELASGYEPHNWTKFQYKSDTSTGRVQRFRNAQRNSDVAPPEPETESDTEQSPQSPQQTGGFGPGHDDPASLASDLCKRAGIAKCGPAAIAQTRRWIEANIPAATMRAVVSSMASKAGGTTLSLKRFDQPIRREHAEYPLAPRQNGRPYEPKTEDELRRAIDAGETYGYDVDHHRTKLAALIADTAAAMRVSGLPA